MKLVERLSNLLPAAGAVLAMFGSRAFLRVHPVSGWLLTGIVTGLVVMAGYLLGSVARVLMAKLLYRRR